MKMVLITNVNAKILAILESIVKNVSQKKHITYNQLKLNKFLKNIFKIMLAGTTHVILAILVNQNFQIAMNVNALAKLNIWILRVNQVGKINLKRIYSIRRFLSLFYQIPEVFFILKR